MPKGKHNDSVQDDVLKQKYGKRIMLTHCQGVTKPIALMMLQYEFGDKIISLVPDKVKRRYVVTLKGNVNDKAYEKFKKYWEVEKKVFELYKSA